MQAVSFRGLSCSIESTMTDSTEIASWRLSRSKPMGELDVLLASSFGPYARG